MYYSTANYIEHNATLHSRNRLLTVSSVSLQVKCSPALQLIWETMHVTDFQNLASNLYPWDCEIYDAIDNIQLLSMKKYPGVLVKLQRDPRKNHVATEMEHEARIYAALESNALVQEVIPRFHGHSTHLGVAMTCIEQELDDFDDIGPQAIGCQSCGSIEPSRCSSE